MNTAHVNILLDLLIVGATHADDLLTFELEEAGWIRDTSPLRSKKTYVLTSRGFLVAERLLHTIQDVLEEELKRP